MHVNRPPKTVTFALKTLASAVACAVLLSPAANAAGLGKLTVLSSLGQPLRAEIELTAVSADEASGLSAKLAPADAFRLANIDFNPALLSLRFDVDQRNGRQFIRVSSTQPVNEPFVDMLLELSWTGGRLVREYTFLLDPAELRSTQSAQVAAPVDVPSRAAAPAAAPAAAAPSPAALAAAARAQAQPQPQAPAAPRATPAPAPRAAAGEDAKEYLVKPGDTLGRIASRLKPADVSLDMMLVALYRANPEAFVGNNMNRLKSGQILAVPDSDAIKGGAAEGEAHGVVIAHAADFNAYRSKLAGQVSSSTPAKAPESSQSAAGKITAKVEERPTAVTESKDQLKLSKAAGAAAVGKTAVAGEEDKIAREKQVGEANARVKELEKNVADLEKLMAVKNKAMAEKQGAASAPAASAAASAAEPAPAPAPAPKPKAKPPVVAPVAQPGVMDIIMDNIQAIGIALAALLGGAGFLLARRRKQEQAGSILPKQEISVLGDPGAQAQPLIAETGGQSVDTSNSVFNSNFAPSASQLDTNEVDPVAEADVYIAYGRDAQAEEILKEALRTHPERHAVRLKLMEIFANRKDARSFEMQASELYALTKGEGEDWAQAALLGQAVDPQNPLYANAGSGAGAGLGAVAAAGAGAAAGYAAADNAAMDDFASMFAEPPAAEAAPAPTAADFSGLDLDLSQDLAPAAPAAFAAAPQADSNLMDFDLDRDATALPSFDEPAATTPPLPTPASVAAAADADHFLDFDLGGLSFEPVAATPAPAIEMPAPADDEPAIVAEASAPAADAAAEPFDFAFDLDPPAKAEAAPAPAQEAASDAKADDFSMDFGLDLPASANEPTAAPAAQPDPLAELDMMDFKLPDEPAAPAPAPASAELSMDDFDIPGMADATATPAPAAAPAAPEFDLSGIDLDLLGSAAAKAPALGDDEMSALHMEMDTKLDLAIAYQEIGDKEGARELLDEVIRGGSDDQVSRASSMRALLG